MSQDDSVVQYNYTYPTIKTTNYKKKHESYQVYSTNSREFNGLKLFRKFSERRKITSSFTTWVRSQNELLKIDLQTNCIVKKRRNFLFTLFCDKQVWLLKVD